MSSIKLSPNASGTGEFTIAAPNSNTNRTLTLPDQTGTVLTNAGPFTANASASAGAVTIDASNNVGIGTSSPGGKLAVSDGTRTAVINPRSSAAGSGLAVGTDVASSGHVLNLAGDLNGGGTSGGVNISYYSSASGNWNAALRVRNTTSSFSNLELLPDGGNLLVGTTSTSGVQLATAGGLVTNGTENFWMSRSAGGGSTMNVGRTSGAGTGNLVEWTYNGATRGTVTTNGTNVAYNTSSDYRLKHDIQPMVGALAKVALLKPCTYKWNADNSNGEGFIAHELQAVVPDAVTGKKDAVDAEGNPVYQGIDTSFLVATLTAALQELNAKVEAQAAEIAALKGAQ